MGTLKAKVSPRSPLALAQAPTPLARFGEHLRRLTAYTDALRDGRCRPTGAFDAHVEERLAVLRPLSSAWTMEVLFVLYMHGPTRFNGLKRRLGGVSSRVLTDKLRHAVAQGWIARQEGPGALATYRLEPKGEVIARHLHPLLFFLRHQDQVGPGAPPARTPG
jgi:DNA-binding HxlR family transcriptional regulator